MILFFDTETNCFIDETDETPRLIQLSWILEVEKSIIKKNYFAKIEHTLQKVTVSNK